MKTALAAAVLLALPAAASAKIQTKEITYQQGDTPLKGFVAWDDAAKGKRPGVLVVHEWWGHNQHARNQAKRLAKAGYVGFALDMYGEGKSTTHPEDAKKFMEAATKDSAVIQARFDAALDQLKQQPNVDPEEIAAVGYCMGGTIALAMARAGEDLDAVATFHAGLSSDQPPPEKGQVKARILVNHGGSDPMVPPEAVKKFEEQMAAAGADAKVVVYPKAKHGFTNPDAGKAGMDALAYDADADARSWKATMAFFEDVFGKGAKAR